jgi:serine protease
MPDGGAGADAAAVSPDAGPPRAVSGTVIGYTRSIVDSDVNDPDAPYLSNDTLSDAQQLAAPLTLGGYVNAPGAGPDGRSKASGDVVDAYRVSLAAGQLVLLWFEPQDPPGPGDARAAAQIYLLEPDGTPVEDELGLPVEGRSRAHSARYIIPEAAGDYIVLVQAIKGGTSYVLVVDDIHGGASVARRRGDYVPDDVVVRFRNGAAASRAPRPGDSFHGLRYQAGAADREVLYRVDRAAMGDTLASLGASHLAPASSGATTGHARAPLRGPITSRAIAMLLESDPRVADAGPNHILRPLFTPNDPGFDQQWGFANTHAEAAWDVGSGAGVIVAVVDTGIQHDHPDLEDNTVAGYDFVRDPDNADDGDGIDPDPARAPGGHHGTHVAGTIAAITDNDRGVAGMAWSAKVMPVRALGLEGGTEYDVAQSIRFAAGLENDSGALAPAAARVINMSLGGPEYSEWFQRTVNDTVRAGTVVVAAAGNDDTDEPSFPAGYDNVVSVASTTSSNGKSGFSNFGPLVDVAAPGSSILSTWGSGSGYSYSSGTSMACPHAAGWVALMLGVNPALTPADIDAIIRTEDVFTDLGPPGRDDNFGYGLIDAAKAITVAAGYPAGDPVVIPELELRPDQLILGPLQTVARITGGNIGDGDFTAEAATPEASWLTIGAFTASGSDLAFSAAIDRSTHTTPGAYDTAITIELSTGNQTMPVLAIQRELAEPGDLGRQYATLTDPTGTVIATAEIIDGAFDFPAVPPGTYQLRAGADTNHDGAPCGPAESCTAAPTDVTVDDADLTDLALTTDWHTGT